MTYLQYIRSINGLTQTDLAKKVGVSQTTISFAERKKSKLNYDNARKIAEFLGCSMSVLLQDLEVNIK